MQLTNKLLSELQKRLKIGSTRGVHLNAIPSKSRYKFDLHRLSHINSTLPADFIKTLLSQAPFKFKISWVGNVSDINSLFEEEQVQLVKLSKSFDNLINQTETIESEKGVNTFGFGFPLLVRRNQLDNKLIIAPIFIWSLKIKRTNEFNTWEIYRNEDDIIYTNEVLINHLESDSKALVKPLPLEVLEDGLLDEKELYKACKELLETISVPKFNTDVNVFIENIKNVSPIKDKQYYEDISVSHNNPIIEYSGIFSIFEVQKQNVIRDYEDLMRIENLSIDNEILKNNTFQPITSVNTDPSQQNILNEIARTKNLLIQGPPGTGKSQTLTAILINALENKKKTIVVCEKKTALEVLYKSLERKGLQANCAMILDSSNATRKRIVESVRDRVDNSSYRKYRYSYSKTELEALIQKINSLINSVNSKHKNLSKELIGKNKWSDLVGKIMKTTKEFEDKITINFQNINLRKTYEEFNFLLDSINKGKPLFDSYKKYENDRFIAPNKLSGDNPYKIEQELKRAFEEYKIKIEEIEKNEKLYKCEYIASKKSELKELNENIKHINSKINNAFNNSSINSSEILNETESEKKQFKFMALFSKRHRKITEIQKELRELFLSLSKTLKGITEFQSYENNLEGTIKDSIEYLKEAEKIVCVSDEVMENNIAIEFSSINLFDLKGTKYENSSLNKTIDLAQELNELIKRDKWISINYSEKSLKEILLNSKKAVKQFERYFSSDIDIFTIEFKWFQFYNNLSQNEKEIIDKIKLFDNWENVFVYNYINSILIDFVSIDSLPTGDLELKEFDLKLKDLEKEQIRFIKSFWYSLQIDAARNFEIQNADVSIENLYNKKSSNKFKRLSLRQIVQYDTDLFTSYFPIILTTPDACSNLFRGKNDYFDIVMFDEASQLRLEDNLPAVLKGKQVIIAGDEHQMPPSNYFSKIFDGTVEDEDEIEEEERVGVDKDNILLSCESLLDFATELSFEKKFLDFHYRSEHPYLIDFSNHAFYSQRLKPLPNKDNYTPIKYVPVNGTFSGHTNEAEAETILSILDKNIFQKPDGQYPSVGIATFNIAQRDLIKSKILERKKLQQFQSFNEKIQKLEASGLFIKNLENIQGDERDIILLSTTYGIDKDGRFSQRFGPINYQKGYKLLNVIITRAKFKIYICTSVPESYFLNYKEHLIAEKSNNRKAVFYAYLAYGKAISENNHEARNSVLTALKDNYDTTINYEDQSFAELESPFEEEVYQELVKRFGEERLNVQYTFAGFRIDIVYKSNIQNIPLIAIECDGAKYHSSDEAYLFDRHRQNILEKQGFIFHRIWSTNWWRNPKREISNLIDFIIKTEESYKSNIIPNISLNEIFTDEVKPVEFQFTSSDVSDSNEIKRKSKKEIYNVTQSELFKNTIKENSIVEIRYLNTGKNIEVCFGDGDVIKLEKGVPQKINHSSPLAIAILGKQEGDIVRVGNLENYVEIIKIK
jgi:very-short-patch-repair endonuclease